MNKNVLYMTDEYIYLYNNKHKKISKAKMPKNIIKNGKVANINKFIEKYEALLKENNLNNGIIGDKIKIIVHPKYTAADITLLKNIFEKLNYRNITIDNEIKYYKLNEKNAWINVNDSYMLISYIDEYKKRNTILVENDFFSNIEDLYSFINSKVKNKEIYLIGHGKLLEQINENYELEYTSNVYQFADGEYYLINCVTSL